MANINLSCRIEIHSEGFAKHLEPFLYERTLHFQHEFVAFAQSPFDLKAFDDRAQYNFPQTQPALQVPSDDVPTSSAAAAIRERLMAELAVETPWEGSPPLHRQTIQFSSGWESPSVIVIESSDSDKECETQESGNSASQSQQAACEASRWSHPSAAVAEIDKQDDYHHSARGERGRSGSRDKRKGRSKHRDRGRRDSYEYYEEERVVRMRGTDGWRTEERWFVSRRKESWTDSEKRQHSRSPQSKSGKHARRRSTRGEYHVLGEPIVGDTTDGQTTEERPSKQPRLRSVVYVVHKSQDQAQPYPPVDSQQTDTIHAPSSPPCGQIEEPDSPTCEELERELEALESAIRVNKSQLLQALQRIEDLKTARELRELQGYDRYTTQVCTRYLILIVEYSTESEGTVSLCWWGVLVKASDRLPRQKTVN